MPYGTMLADTFQSSAANTAPVFKDGNSVETGKLSRAWLNYTGSATTVRGSFNISSVTRNGTGDYTPSFSVPVADANYALTTSSNHSRTDVREACYCGPLYIGDFTASSTRVATGQTGFTYIETSMLSISIFR